MLMQLNFLSTQLIQNHHHQFEGLKKVKTGRDSLTTIKISLLYMI